MTATPFGTDLLDGLHEIEGHAADLIRGLRVTAARLAEERDDARVQRDIAMQMASRETKDRIRERREFQARLRLRDALITSLRATDDDKNRDLRQADARIHELAVALEAAVRELDARQRQTPEPASRWRQFTQRRSRA